VKQFVLVCCLALFLFGISPTVVRSDDKETKTKEFVKKVIAAGGGEEKLLTLFRMTEQYNSGKKLVPPGKPRISVVEPPRYWWIGTKERGKEPAKIAVWAWTLGILTDPKSKIELISDINDDDKPLAGLRVTGSVNPALAMYFNKSNYQLARVDWRSHFYRFSEWKEHDGAKYPSQCVIYTRSSGKPWFFHEVMSIERLKKLPEELAR